MRHRILPLHAWWPPGRRPCARFDLHTHRQSADLALHDLPGKPVGGNAVAHHAAEQRRRLVHDDLVPEAPQVVCSRRARQARNRRPARVSPWPVPPVRATSPRSMRESPRNRSMALIPTASSTAARLHAVWQGWKQARPMTAGKRVVRARSGATPPRRSRPRRGTATLDVLPGRARVVARREPVDVDGSLDPPRAGLVGQAGPDLEGDRERLPSSRRRHLVDSSRRS